MPCAGRCVNLGDPGPAARARSGWIIGSSRPRPDYSCRDSSTGRSARGRDVVRAPWARVE